MGTVDVVFAEVILASEKLDITAIKPIARMGYYNYAVIDETFEMVIPGASNAAKDGLEGKL